MKIAGLISLLLVAVFLTAWGCAVPPGYYDHRDGYYDRYDHHRHYDYDDHDYDDYGPYRHPRPYYEH